jgi:hypothetical protein
MIKQKREKISKLNPKSIDGIGHILKGLNCIVDEIKKNEEIASASYAIVHALMVKNNISEFSIPMSFLNTLCLDDFGADSDEESDCLILKAKLHDEKAAGA